MRGSDKVLFSKFKKSLERIKSEVVVVEDEYVIIRRDYWEDSQRRFNYYTKLQKAIYGSIN